MLGERRSRRRSRFSPRRARAAARSRRRSTVSTCSTPDHSIREPKSTRSSPRSRVVNGRSILLWLKRVFGEAGDGQPSHGELAGSQWELERPWLINWQWVPKRSAGPGFGPRDYARARARGAEVARGTFGNEAWDSLRRHGYVDVPSRRLAG